MKNKNYTFNLKHLKFVFLLFSFSLFEGKVSAQLPCGQDIDLNTWSVEGEPTAGSWSVNPGGSSVNQTINGTPTWFVSPNDFFNVLIQGSITVNTAADDDLVGFVFGYKNPIGVLTTPSNTNMETFIFDWKQTTQTFSGMTSNEGFALYEQDGTFDFTDITTVGSGSVYPDLWRRINTPTITVLDTDYGTTRGWNDNQTYDFQLKYTADSIVIWIDSVRIFEEVGCFEPGKFGFYNHSQNNVTYSDFSFIPEYDFTVDSIFCIGDSVQFEIGSGCGDTFPDEINFDWIFGDSNLGTGIDPIHQYTSAGTYTVYMIFTDTVTGCTDTAETTITINGDCCNAATDPQFSLAQNVNVDTHWTGKIFVPDNTIITVDNAILDITNVDVVFGECAGIDFINGATMRANNSVFRPCNLNDTWRGLRFEDQTDYAHQINENTFKNAEIALLFEKNANAEINSNTFSNCNEGLKMNASIFTKSIFGNNFVTNNAFPKYTACYESTSPNDVIHIHYIGSENGQFKLGMVINENNFVMTNANGNLTATAIDMLNGQASISENTMTNMRFAIVIDDPNGPTFMEGNEIENNFQFMTASSSLFQIGVFNSNGVNVSIKSNEQRNSSNYSSTGILLSRVSNISISNNFLEGFSNGINGRRATVLNISENTMNSIKNIGISIGESGMNGRNYITCNDITMVMGQGISILTNRSSRFTEISSNCLKDGREGIRVSTIGGNIPVIRNNYIYNYQVGINNFGHSGNIGTSTDPGMNTLWSNNNSAIDINSNVLLQVANNFGMFNIGGLVQITQNNPTHSTASCGHQIFNMPSQGSLNTKYTCDNELNFIAPKMKMNGNILLPEVSKAIDYLSHSENKKEIISQLAKLKDCSESYLTQIISAIEIEQEDIDAVWYNFHKHNGHFEKAHKILNNMGANGINNFVQIEKLNLKRLEIGHLDENDFTVLNTILEDTEIETAIYNLAVSLSKTGNSHGKYKHFNESIVFEDQSGSINRINEDKTSLEIFPNPSRNEINIQVLEGKIIAGQELIIYDMYGHVVQTNQLGFVSGREKINISALASGTYFVVLVSDGSRSERTRFIKL